MFATSAGVFWYLRGDGLWPRWAGITLAALALINTLLLLEGRSGYLVALTTIALAIMWSMPRHLRVPALVITPVVLLLGLSLGSAKVHERVTKVFNESQNFTHTTLPRNEESVVPAATPFNPAPYPVLVGTAITGARVKPATTLGNAPSMPATMPMCSSTRFSLPFCGT